MTLRVDLGIEAAVKTMQSRFQRKVGRLPAIIVESVVGCSKPDRAIPGSSKFSSISNPANRMNLY